MAGANEEDQIILKILNEEQLDTFYIQIRNQLQITCLSHFDFVKLDDFVKIGMGKPGARRLLEAVKKARWKLRQKHLLTSLKGLTGRVGRQRDAAKHTTFTNPHKSGFDIATSSLTCLIQEKELKLGDQIGDGSFGIVFKGIWETTMGESLPVAIKVPKQDDVNTFANEIKSLHQLNHPNIIRLYGVVLSSPMMMVAELANLGCLLNYLRKQCGHVSILEIWNWILQVTSGMAYLESQRVVHCDLACRNVLLVSKEEVKIGDFGLMRTLTEEHICHVILEGQKLPLAWCAPESLKSGQFSHASDTWMLGITMWEMFSFGEEPWLGLNGAEVLQKIDIESGRPIQPNVCPSNIYGIMTQCWAAEPSERPAFSVLRAEFARIFPEVFVAGESFKEEDCGKLDILEDDKIIVIDGRPDHYYWKGQNERTFDVGLFPRCMASTICRQKTDISKPLLNSFIHTDHGGKNSWGNPNFIDEVYLKNPMEPPDILGIIDKYELIPKLPGRGSNSNIAIIDKFKTEQSVHQIQHTMLINEISSNVKCPKEENKEKKPTRPPLPKVISVGILKQNSYKKNEIIRLCHVNSPQLDQSSNKNIFNSSLKPIIYENLPSLEWSECSTESKGGSEAQPDHFDTSTILTTLPTVGSEIVASSVLPEVAFSLGYNHPAESSLASISVQTGNEALTGQITSNDLKNNKLNFETKLCTNPFEVEYAKLKFKVPMKPKIPTKPEVPMKPNLNKRLETTSERLSAADVPLSSEQSRSSSALSNIESKGPGSSYVASGSSSVRNIRNLFEPGFLGSVAEPPTAHRQLSYCEERDKGWNSIIRELRSEEIEKSHRPLQHSTAGFSGKESDTLPGGKAAETRKKGYDAAANCLPSKNIPSTNNGELKQHKSCKFMKD